MNTLKLENVRDFPLTTEALKFMQDSYSILEKLNGLGGDNYILSGCVVTGSSVSAGFMCLKGMVMPFVAGTIQTNVRIMKTVNEVSVGTGVREETLYYAEFGTSANPDNNVPWENIQRLIGISTLASRLTALEGLSSSQAINITPSTDYNLLDSSYFLRIVVSNKTVSLSFKVFRNNPVGFYVGRIPEAFRPSNSIYFVCGVGGSSSVLSGVTSSGFIEVGTASINVNLVGSATWVIQ